MSSLKYAVASHGDTASLSRSQEKVALDRALLRYEVGFDEFEARMDRAYAATTPAELQTPLCGS